MLPSVVEYLYDELDGVSDLMSPVQPLLTQARGTERSNIQAIVEKHYERYMDQEEEYMREHQQYYLSDSDSDVPSCFTLYAHPISVCS